MKVLADEMPNKESKELQVKVKELTRELSDINNSLEDLSAEHIAVLTKLEQTKDHKHSIEHSLTNKNGKELLEVEIHSAKIINTLVDELNVNKGNYTFEERTNKDEMKKLGNEIYNDFFKENQCSLEESVKKKNDKFESLFELYNKLLENDNLNVVSMSTKDTLVLQEDDSIKELSEERKGLTETVTKPMNEEKYKEELDNRMQIIVVKDQEIDKLKTENAKLLRDKYLDESHKDTQVNSPINCILENKIQELTLKLEEQAKVNARLESLNSQLIENFSEYKRSANRTTSEVVKKKKHMDWSITRRNKRTKLSNKYGTIVRNYPLSLLSEKIKALGQFSGITLTDRKCNETIILDVTPFIRIGN